MFALASQSDYTSQISNIFNILLLALFVASIALTLLSSSQRKRQQPKSIYTKVTCFKCGYSFERMYQKGDYIGKTVGRCPRCDSYLVISAIYEVRPGEREEEKKLLRLVERRG